MHIVYCPERSLSVGEDLRDVCRQSDKEWLDYKDASKTESNTIEGFVNAVYQDVLDKLKEGYPLPICSSWTAGDAVILGMCHNKDGSVYLTVAHPIHSTSVPLLKREE